MKKTTNYTFQHEIESSEKSHLFFKKEDVLYHIPSFHNSYEILYLLEGSVEATISGKKYRLEPNDVCVIAPNHIHYYETLSSEVLAYVAVIGHNYSHHLRALYPEVSFLHVSHNKEANLQLKPLFDEWFAYQGGPLKNFGFINLLFDKILSLFGDLENDTTPLENLAVQFINYLQTNYRQNLTLDSVAKHFGYSKSYFCALFKDLVGSTFLDVLNNIRLEKAVELINDQHKKLSMTTVCEECGFPSVSTFYRLYKKYTSKYFS